MFNFYKKFLNIFKKQEEKKEEGVGAKNPISKESRKKIIEISKKSPLIIKAELVKKNKK